MSRKTQTIIRTVILALALINQVLTSLGYSPLPIDDDQLETLVSVGFTVAASLWAWWKNNSVTKAAQRADNYLDAIKAAKKRGDYHV